MRLDREELKASLLVIAGEARTLEWGHIGETALTLGISAPTLRLLMAEAGVTKPRPDGPRDCPDCERSIKPRSKRRTRMEAVEAVESLQVFAVRQGWVVVDSDDAYLVDHRGCTCAEFPPPCRHQHAVRREEIAEVAAVLEKIGAHRRLIGSHFAGAVLEAATGD